MYDSPHSRQPACAHAEAGWAALTEELDRWRAAGETATFWWRDDDASAPSEPLERLLALGRTLAVDLAIAVVPAPLDAALRRRLTGEPRVAVLQHGYSHHNFAAPGERKIELDGSRPAEHVIAELAVGAQKLSALPGWLPVLVPPWNRIAPHLLPLLPEIGFRGLSARGARNRAQPAPGLSANNVHVDPIDWRGRYGPPRGFVGTARALDAAIGHLADRRTGRADRDEATGLLTHHLVQDEDCWRLVERFVTRTRVHPAAEWRSAAALFEPER